MENLIIWLIQKEKNSAKFTLHTPYEAGFVCKCRIFVDQKATLVFNIFLQSQKTSCREAEGRKLLCKFVTIGTFQAATDVMNKLIKSFIQ